MPGKLSDVALRTSLLYALLAAVWILVSDKVLVALVPDPEIMGAIALCKGWAFVLLTALLLFGVLRGQLQRWEQETAARRRAEAYLAEAQSLSHTGSLGWNVATDEHIWSEETFRIFELDASTKITLPLILERIHPDDRTLARETLERTGRERKELDYEHRLLMPDGRVKHLHIVARCLTQEPGRVEFIGAVMDVTAQKRAQVALRRSEAYLAEAQKLTHTGSWTRNPATGEFLYCSEEMLRIFAWNAQQGLPTNEIFAQRIHPDDRAQVLQKIEKAREQESDYDTDFRILFPDGTMKFIQTTAHVVVGETGEVVEWFGTAMDVTERKEVEETIRRSEAFLAEGQRISHTGSWAWHPTTGEMISSKERCRIFGIDPEQTKASFDVFSERVHPEDQPRFKQAFDSAIREKRDFEHEYRIVTPDGFIKHLHSVGQAVVNQSGELVEFIGTTMDITDRKRAEEALQEAQSELARVTRVTMMGELVASIAHEVNQPLAGVVMSANAGLNWLAKDPPNLPKVREAVERVLRDGVRAGDILNRIRALLKKTTLTKSPVSVNQVIRDVLALAGSELRQENVELSLALDPKLPVVMGDSIQLQQVLLNLIVNALEAMAGITNLEKTLRIRSGAGEMDGKAAVLVQVSDSGVGLGAGEAGRLFEAFHTTKANGMGMGLWISRSIVENHGGRLTAQSNAGSGATFQVLLPTQAGGCE